MESSTDGGPGRSLTEKKKCSGTSFPKKARGHSMCSTMVGGGWRLAVGGGWRLAVGNWRLVAVGGGWRRLVVGDWWLVAVGSGWQLAVGRRWRLAAVGGGWWRLAVDGSWRLAVGGPLGPSLWAVLSKKKKKSGPLRTALRRAAWSIGWCRWWSDHERKARVAGCSRDSQGFGASVLGASCEASRTSIGDHPQTCLYQVHKGLSPKALKARCVHVKKALKTHNSLTHRPGSPTPCVTFRRVAVSLRGPGQSPVLPSACCVGSLRCVGRCGRCSCWCRFRVRGAQWLTRPPCVTFRLVVAPLLGPGRSPVLPFAWCRFRVRGAQ